MSSVQPLTPVARSAAEVIASSCPPPENYVTLPPVGPEELEEPAPGSGKVGFTFLKFDNYHH